MLNRASLILPVIVIAACHGRDAQVEHVKVEHASEVKPAATAPRVLGDSIYALSVSLTDQAGNKAGLDVFRGHPVIISMFYASCPSACPLLIHNIQSIESHLSPEQQAATRVLLVSFDPENDSPSVLRTLADKQHVDLARWKLARADKDDVRSLAAVLNIRYRRLPDGNFNHSSVITIVDQSGAPRFRQEGLSSPSAEPEQVLASLTGAQAASR